MIVVPQNDSRIAAATNIAQRTSGNLVFFQVGTDKGGNPIETSVITDGSGNFQFFPERSYVQRTLMTLLGLGALL